MKFQKKLKNIDNPVPVIVIAAFVLFVIILGSFHVSKWLIGGFVVFGLFVARLLSGKLRLAENDIILFWGLPGSGKTMFLSKTSRQLKKQGWKIAGNDQFCECSSYVDYNFDKKYHGWFSPLPHTALFIDEASLNGWDNRDWAKNFTPERLDFWKKHRQERTAIVLSNQGFAELDCKIRDTLTTCIYYVQDRGRYSRAIRMDKDVRFDPDTGLPLEGYRIPSIFSRLLDPSSVLYVWHSSEGKHFKSFLPTPKPSILDKDDFVIITDRAGNITKLIPRDHADSDVSQDIES